MVPNQLLLKLTQVSIGICHSFSLFQEISFPEGVRHFLGLMEQPPTPLITLVTISFTSRRVVGLFGIHIIFG